LYKLLTFRLGSNLSIGLFINLLLGVSFFFNINPELVISWYSNPDKFISFRLDLDKNNLAISPFILYLYLNPLYSIRGGSTFLAEPFMKNPILEERLDAPLYK
jgi:hypothetical protein